MSRSWLDAALSRGRVIAALCCFLAGAGAVAWTTMPRQEDPRIPDRFAMAVIPFPGASAEDIEHHIVEPAESELGSVVEVMTVESFARPDAAVLVIQLRDHIDDVEPAWDQVEEALEAASREFPDGAGEIDFNDTLFSDQELVVLAITGSSDRLELAAGAEELRDRLIRIAGVADVRLVADPGEQITIGLEDSAARRYGLSPPALAELLGARTRTVAAGAASVADRQARIDTDSALGSVKELRQTPILLPSGAAVPLSDLAEVRRSPLEPASELMRHDLEPAVGLAVIAQPDIDVVALGAELRREIAAGRAALEARGLRVSELSFQPDYVERRLADLGGSLLLGVAIVAAVLFATMGLRLGAVVVIVVPLVALSSLAIYWFGGGVLHQLSVAALILSLGLLVDNAIVSPRPPSSRSTGAPSRALPPSLRPASSPSRSAPRPGPPWPRSCPCCCRPARPATSPAPFRWSRA